MRVKISEIASGAMKIAAVPENIVPPELESMHNEMRNPDLGEGLVPVPKLLGAIKRMVSSMRNAGPSGPAEIVTPPENEIVRNKMQEIPLKGNVVSRAVAGAKDAYNTHIVPGLGMITEGIKAAPGALSDAASDITGGLPRSLAEGLGMLGRGMGTAASSGLDLAKRTGRSISAAAAEAMANAGKAYSASSLVRPHAGTPPAGPPKPGKGIMDGLADMKEYGIPLGLLGTAGLAAWLLRNRKKEDEKE